MSPFRRRTLTVTSCSCHTTTRSALASPTRRSAIFARPKNGGSDGRTNEILDVIAPTRMLRQAWNIRNTAVANHAWGAPATAGSEFRRQFWPRERRRQGRQTHVLRSNRSDSGSPVTLWPGWICSTTTLEAWRSWHAPAWAYSPAQLLGGLLPSGSSDQTSS